MTTLQSKSILVFTMNHSTQQSLNLVCFKLKLFLPHNLNKVCVNNTIYMEINLISFSFSVKKQWYSSAQTDIVSFPDEICLKLLLMLNRNSKLQPLPPPSMRQANELQVSIVVRVVTV